jgi:hypothetical protein
VVHLPETSELTAMPAMQGEIGKENLQSETGRLKDPPTTMKNLPTYIQSPFFYLPIV